MPSDPKREVTRIRLRSLSRMSPLALPAILPKFPFALSQRYTCRSSRSMNLLAVMTHRKNLSEYQFESGTSHLRCLRLAFREGLPRRHVCGKNISLSLSLSLSCSFSRSLVPACAPTRVGTQRTCRPGSTRPCVGAVARIDVSAELGHE